MKKPKPKVESESEDSNEDYSEDDDVSSEAGVPTVPPPPDHQATSEEPASPAKSKSSKSNSVSSKSSGSRKSSSSSSSPSSSGDSDSTPTETAPWCSKNDVVLEFCMGDVVGKRRTGHNTIYWPEDAHAFKLTQKKKKGILTGYEITCYNTKHKCEFDDGFRKTAAFSQHEHDEQLTINRLIEWGLNGVHPKDPCYHRDHIHLSDGHPTQDELLERAT